MKEKEFQTDFSNWVKNNKNYIKEKYGKQIVFELKISNVASIRFDALREHQAQALIDAGKGGEGCYHKINDQPFIPNNNKMRFTNPKPFDCFFISDAIAYVVVFFYKPRELKTKREFYLLQVNDWVDLEKRSEKKSIREEELRLISSVEKLFEYRSCIGLKNSV